METDDAATLREVAGALAGDGYALTARVLRDIARRLERSTLDADPPPCKTVRRGRPAEAARASPPAA